MIRSHYSCFHKISIVFTFIMKKLFAFFVYLFACGVWVVFFSFFWLHCTAWGILVPQPEIEPTNPAVKAQSPTGLQGKPQKGFKERKKVKSLSRVQLCVTPWTVAHQTPPSMGFSRQEYLNGLSFLSPGDLPDPGIEPRSPTLQADSLLSKSQGKPKRF